MTTLISSSMITYSNPRDVKIGNMTYNNIHFIDSKDFIDNDNKRKIVNYMTSKDGEYVSYLEDGVVTRSSKRYNVPVTKTLGGRVYNNICSNVYLADGTKIYEDMQSTLSRNIITVKPSGEVIDGNLLRSQNLKAKFTKPLKVLGNMLRKLV